MSPRARRVAKALLAAEILGIVWLVLNPSPATPSGAVLRISDFLLGHGVPGWAANATGWEYLCNVALFLPLGVLSSLIWDDVLLEVWVLVGFTVSGALEATQYLFLDQRSATLTDISSNTVGMFLGAAVGSLALAFLERRRAGNVEDALVYD